MDKVKILNAMKTMKDTISTNNINMLTTDLTIAFKVMSDLQKEIELDALKSGKGSKEKARATAIVKFAEKIKQYFFSGNYRPDINGVFIDKESEQDAIMSPYHAVMLTNKVPDAAPKADLPEGKRSLMQIITPYQYKYHFKFTVKTLEMLKKFTTEKKKKFTREEKKILKNEYKGIVIGTEDKKFQVRLNPEYMLDIARCIQRDDGTIDLYSYDDKRAVKIETEHGIGIIMPARMEFDRENEWVIPNECIVKE